ncbi:MAG TPA: ribonuclease G, partial [Polyangiaceae bacterium]|nr:ribonuclease G [Polyangiaceae bacterium]
MPNNLLVVNVEYSETRVALIEEGILTELQTERTRGKTMVGNVYLGKVTRVLPGMQAAFVDIGQDKAAFLHVEDVIRPDDFEQYLAGGDSYATADGSESESDDEAGVDTTVGGS